MPKRTVILLVLDGWGIGPPDDSNPIHAAHLKNLPWLAEHFPMTSLEAAGIHVGLPWGETGNSEVGHMTMGAGKILYQHYPRISLAIRNGEFNSNPALSDAFEHAQKNNGATHLVGLLSKANTHASLEHLLALIKLAETKNTPYFLHLFADGKDSPPRSIFEMLPALPANKIATMTGRYYAMDREANWQLTRAAYECLVSGSGRRATDPMAAAQATVADLKSEEFMPPTRFREDGLIGPRDAAIFFNFREDSIRQIAESFILENFSGFPVAPAPERKIVTFTEYEARFRVPVAFPPDHVAAPLAKVISDAGLAQVHLAESYKYAHVTIFFNGYREEPFPGEYRVLIPSLQVPHPEEHPDLMAPAINDRLIQSIESRGFDFILANFANGDTIGHTGNYDAAVATVKVVDREVGRIIRAVAAVDGVLLITSDHGNIERVYDPVTGRPDTAHDPSPVPLYLAGSQFHGKRFRVGGGYGQEAAGNLADVAPTVLAILGLPQPPEMTGRSLLKDIV